MAKQQEVLYELIEYAIELKNKVKKLTERYNTTCKNIKNISIDVKNALSTTDEELFTEQEIRDGKYATKNGNCLIYKRISIDYDYEKLKEKLDKTLLNEITTKKYELNNPKEFIKKLKKYGVPLSVVKEHILSDTFADKKKIQELFDKDILSLNDIEGCYVAKITSHVKISEK